MENLGHYNVSHVLNMCWGIVLLSFICKYYVVERERFIGGLLSIKNYLSYYSYSPECWMLQRRSINRTDQKEEINLELKL